MMKNDNDDKLQKVGSPLEGLYGLTPEQFQSLKNLWITTIDDFVSATVTQEGCEGLCNLLGIEMPELKRLMQIARVSLGDERYNELRIPKPGGPTGVLLDDHHKVAPDDKSPGNNEDL